MQKMRGKCEKGGKIEKKLIREQGCANAPLGFAIMVLLNILNCNNSGCRGCPKYPNYYCKGLREQMAVTLKKRDLPRPINACCNNFLH